jgi:hypothetical protein
MRYSNAVLSKLLKKLIPGIKNVLKILDSKEADSEKVFQIRVAIWNAESDVQKEIKQFLEDDIFSPTQMKKLPSQAKTIGFKKHKDLNTYYPN